MKCCNKNVQTCIESPSVDINSKNLIDRLWKSEAIAINVYTVSHWENFTTKAESEKLAKQRGKQIDEEIETAVEKIKDDNEKLFYIINEGVLKHTRFYNNCRFTNYPLNVLTRNFDDELFNINDNVGGIINIGFNFSDFVTSAFAFLGCPNSNYDIVNINKLNNKFNICEKADNDAIYKITIEIPINRYYINTNYPGDPAGEYNVPVNAQKINDLERILKTIIDAKVNEENLYYNYSVTISIKKKVVGAIFKKINDRNQPPDRPMPKSSFIEIEQSRRKTLGLDAGSITDLTQSNGSGIIKCISARSNMSIHYPSVETIMHEFCHILGMIHAHQIEGKGNPYLDEYWETPEYFLKNFKIDGSNRIANYTKKELTLDDTIFDPLSIMSYDLIDCLFKESVRKQLKMTTKNFKLSDIDKKILKQYYPNKNVILENYHYKPNYSNKRIFIGIITCSLLLLLILLVTIVI